MTKAPELAIEAIALMRAPGTNRQGDAVEPVVEGAAAKPARVFLAVQVTSSSAGRRGSVAPASQGC